MRAMSIAKMAPMGSSLPSRISSVVAGVTCSCSKVPASRSLTMATAVMSTARNERTKPKVPETMNGTPSRVGLNSAEVTTSGLPRGGRGPSVASVAPAAATMARSHASALPARTASAPS
jgi:hypothetical protein